jgi:phospholipase C
VSHAPLAIGDIKEELMSWHTMSEIEPNLLHNAVRVTSVPRAGELLDLFATGQGGGIYTTHGSATSSWAPWAPIDAAISTEFGVTAVARDQNRVDLFVAAGDGIVYWSRRTGADSFAPFSRVYPAFNRAHSQVSAIARGAENLDLFVTTFEGQIFTTYWDVVKQQWSSWLQIDGNFSKASYFNASAVVSRHPDSMELFVTGTDGLVYQASRQAMAPWSGFVPVPDNGSFATAGSQVAAISRDPDHIDLFVVGFNNRIYNNSWETNRGWVTWQFIDDDFSVQTRAPLTVVARDANRLDVFVASQLDSIRSTTWESGTGWRRWWDWIDYTFTNKSGEAAAVQWIGTKRMELCVAGSGYGAVSCTYWDPLPAVLRRAAINFQTHNDDKDSASVVHVFVKNRASSSLTPEAHADWVPNLFELPRYAPGGDLSVGKRNPYLAIGQFLGAGVTFDDPGNMGFELELAAADITVNDIELPEVDICFVNDKGALGGYDKWIFDYTVSLIFDDGPFMFSSTHNGSSGIVLDENNRTHSGIGIENYRRTVPVLETPTAKTNAVLYSVTLEFYTHLNGDNKNADTSIDVRVSNRVDESTQHDIARGTNLFSNDEFPDDGDDDHPEYRYRSITWSGFEPMDFFTPMNLADIVLPMISITITPHGFVGYDTWMFDYQVTLAFGDPATTTIPEKQLRYSWRRTGVILDQDNRTHVGVYQGGPFPTASPPTTPTLEPTNDPEFREKSISIAFLQSKLAEFINDRAVPHTGPDTGSLPPLFKIHLGSVGQGEDYPFPESYANIQRLVNGDSGLPIYLSAIRSLGQLTKFAGIGNAYIRDLDCDDIYFNIYADRTPPIEVTLSFTSGGSIQTHGDGRVDILTLSITLKLTLVRGTIANPFNGTDSIIDLFSWAPAYVVNRDDSSDLLDEYIQVNLITGSAWDFGDQFRGAIRDQIANTLTNKDPFFPWRTLRDDLNSQVTSWLVGGLSDGAYNTDDNNIRIQNVRIERAIPTVPDSEDRIVINYRGPQNSFAPPAPDGWQAQADFSPSTLDNIKHIVVLMKENRSFDHLLGYLSLPVEQEGMGRVDVDGLHGGESNSYKGQSYPVFKLEQSRFVPGPPNGYESTHLAINGGAMDGFVRSHAELNNDAVAGQVMGYYTGSTVWAYDALARDFAIGHRWFASHPGPTFPNRYYALSGRPNLDAQGFWEFENSSPIRPVFTPTIFDALNGATDRLSGEPVTWRYFENAYCTLRFFEQYTFDHKNIVGFDDPDNGFLACAASGRLPSVSFIDPHFVDYPPGSNCDEPPSDIADGQEFVDKVVQAVVSSPQWNQTLLLIVYDEHGGFFDHVPPRVAPEVSDEMPICTVGLRIPALVVSPWVTPGSVFGSAADARVFDHTSILKTIARRFLANPPYMGARYAAANDLSSVIRTQLSAPQFLPYLRYRLQFSQSQTMLDAGVANAAPKTALRHIQANGTTVQDFCLEDAGDGWFYIRVHTNGLYASVETPEGSGQPVLVQGRRNGSSSASNPDLQQWKFSAPVSSSDNADRYVISNKAYPQWVVRPGTADTVVLAQSTGGEATWNVACPLLGGGTRVV